MICAIYRDAVEIAPEQLEVSPRLLNQERLVARHTGVHHHRTLAQRQAKDAVLKRALCVIFARIRQLTPVLSAARSEGRIEYCTAKLGRIGRWRRGWTGLPSEGRFLVRGAGEEHCV